jgi:hypothetical protein
LFLTLEAERDERARSAGIVGKREKMRGPENSHDESEKRDAVNG